MQLCSRCRKRMAVVFVTKLENGESQNEGLCLKCARELGIPQMDSMLSNMGISDEDLDNMEDEIGNLLSQVSEDAEDGDDEGDGDDAASRTPALDFAKLFGSLPFMNGNAPKNEGNVPAKKEDGSKKDSPKDKAKDKDKKKKEKERRYLSMYCRDLTEAAREGKLDAVIGRERETARMMQILSRRQKNNPCLIGEPGVGKTAIAEALAQKIVSGDVPYKLREKEVYLVDLTALVAGTQFRGQFESRVKGLIDEVKALGNIILVIDEVHSIVGVGDSEGSMNAANILKPALSRGEIQLIGATTLTEYRKYIEKDSALERRFQPIIVEEPSIAETKKILGGIKKYYETYHRINISDAIISRAVELSERYITDRFLPDKAIDLLDEAAAYVAMHSPVVNRVAVVEKELAALKAQIAEIEENPLPADADDERRNAHYELVASIKASQLKDEAEYEKLKAELATIELTVDSLARVIEIWTGVPAGTINANEFERLNTLSDRLKDRIKGQDAAVDAVVRAIKRNRAGVSYKRKPASFIFAGPTGVGKTELVKVLATDLFSTPDALIRLDMSEFMEKHSVSRMIGSPPGYVGYDDAGQLTEKIRRKPYSVVLFDEIEKAHPDVLNILLQILDDGKVTDSHGKEVDFSSSIIVMTTNAGASMATNTPGFGMSGQSIAENRTERALSEFLRPEFLNRVDEIITFRQLDKEDFGRIAANMINDLRTALAEKGISVSCTDEALALIAEKSFSTKYGARNMRRFISRNIEDIAAEKIISAYDQDVKEIIIDVNGEELSVDVR
ncbi:MAG: ATP-dependent Clp protease ATP-binding subunit [Ruminococcaceae bacterium]|nr:ATP-dependent Clp protease ATP-binding subunit [Oscillospiraceae bacterium]